MSNTDGQRKKDDGDYRERWVWEDKPTIDRTKTVIIADEGVFALLEFARKFQGKYLPCFNSDLRNSMSLMYRVMGKHVRKIGEHDLILTCS